MKKRCSITAIIIVAMIIISSGFSIASHTNKEVTQIFDKYELISHSKWTFLAYLDGDYPDLEEDVLKFINDMELVGSNNKVNIIVQIDDCTIWDKETRRYKIILDENQERLASYNVNDNMWLLSEQNMGDSQTLSDFINWGVQNFPADNYCLLLFNHGLGWKSICNDITDQDYLEINEIKQALSDSYSLTGEEIDILSFYACYMGMIETFYPICEYVDYCIASEFGMNDEDICFKDILEILVDNPYISPFEFTKEFIEKSFLDTGGIYYHHLFGIKMEKIPFIVQKINELSNHFLSKMPSRNSLNDFIAYSNINYLTNMEPYPHDLYRYAEIIRYKDISPKLNDCAEYLMDLINDSVIVPDLDDKHLLMPRGKGISIYYPPKKGSILKDFYDEEYDDILFSHDTKWDEFIKKSYTVLSLNKNKLLDFSFLNKIISKIIAPSAGLEPATARLTAECSTN